MQTKGADLQVRPVSSERWGDLAQLFEQPGPRGGRQDTANCWCSVWRYPSRSPEENKQRLCELVHAGDEPGLLAYRDGDPVGWVSVAPREHFPSLLRSRQFRPHDADADVFVVTCFAVARQARRTGIGLALVAAAVDRALERGASAVEGYPGDPPDYKGRAEWFVDYGFVPVRKAGKRTVMRFTPG